MADVELERPFRDWRAKIHGDGQRIAGALRMIEQRAAWSRR
jgi:hypothetical protein